MREGAEIAIHRRARSLVLLRFDYFASTFSYLRLGTSVCTACELLKSSRNNIRRDLRKGLADEFLQPPIKMLAALVLTLRAFQNFLAIAIHGICEHRAHCFLVRKVA